VKLDIKRSPEECCSNYFDTAKEIAKITFPVGSDEWHDAAIRKIKRFGHHEKLSVYVRVMRWFSRAQENQALFVPAIETLAIKIRTHEDFSSREDWNIL